MKLEGFDTLPDLINLSFNLNRYPLIRDIGDMGKIGREYLLTVNGCVPADDADDPKYAELGRELIQSGNGIFTEHGMLFVDENTPFQRSYDGQTFPPYLYDPGVLCVAKAVGDDPRPVEDDMRGTVMFVDDKPSNTPMRSAARQTL